MHIDKNTRLRIGTEICNHDNMVNVILKLIYLLSMICDWVTAGTSVIVGTVIATL